MHTCISHDQMFIHHRGEKDEATDAFFFLHFQECCLFCLGSVWPPACMWTMYVYLCVPVVNTCTALLPVGPRGIEQQRATGFSNP